VLPPPEEVLLTAVGATKKNNVPGMGGGTRIIKKHSVSDQVSEDMLKIVG
jgi:bifunctional pyridoxal-dependent enzyme with beta-cystathionase and maltose regulon repressor activities